MCFVKTLEKRFCDSVLRIQLVNLLPSLSLFGPSHSSLMHALFWTPPYRGGTWNWSIHFPVFGFPQGLESTRTEPCTKKKRRESKCFWQQPCKKKKNTFLSFWQLGMFMNCILHEAPLFASQPYHWGSLGWGSRTTRSRLMTHSYCTFYRQSRRVSTSSRRGRNAWSYLVSCSGRPGSVQYAVHLLPRPSSQHATRLLSYQSLLRFAKAASSSPRPPSRHPLSHHWFHNKQWMSVLSLSHIQ